MKKQLNQQDRSEVIFIAIIILIFAVTSLLAPEDEKIDWQLIEVNTIEESNPLPDLTLAQFEDFESVGYRVITARVTAYAPFDNVSGICADEDPSVTSIGHYPSSAYIAVNPVLIPYGTEVFIPGYGLTESGDTGGALRSYDGYAIDVFFDTYEEALAWGVQYLEVWIYAK